MKMRYWFPLWSAKMLRGSTPWEFSIEEYAIWVKIMSMANENKPLGQIDYFSFDQLVGELSKFRKEKGRDAKYYEKLVKKTLEISVEKKKINWNQRKNRIVLLTWDPHQVNGGKKKSSPAARPNSGQSPGKGEEMGEKINRCPKPLCPWEGDKGAGPSQDLCPYCHTKIVPIDPIPKLDTNKTENRS